MKYRTDVDLTNRNSSQAAIARAIIASAPTGAKVLDVGCAAGDLGAVLHDRGFVVTGIEADKEAAAVASEKIDSIVVADLEADQLTDIVGGPFDVVIFGDVLEHLQHPEATLQGAVSLLSPEGLVIASIPNVGHGSLRLALLLGQWTYTEEGLLDRTHVRFFTLDGIRDLFSSAALAISSIQATVLDPLSAGVSFDDRSLPGDIVEWVRDQDGAYDFQYIVQAEPAVVGRDLDVGLPEVERLVPIERPDDDHTQRRRDQKLAEVVARRRSEQLASFEEERYKLLTTKDYAIGVESELGRLRYDVGQRNDDLHQVRTELIQTHARLAAAIEDAQAAHRRLDVLPHNLVKRGARKVAREIGLR